MVCTSRRSRIKWLHLDVIVKVRKYESIQGTAWWMRNAPAKTLGSFWKFMGSGSHGNRFQFLCRSFTLNFEAKCSRNSRVMDESDTYVQNSLARQSKPLLGDNVPALSKFEILHISGIRMLHGSLECPQPGRNHTTFRKHFLLPTSIVLTKCVSFWMPAKSHGG